MLEDVAGEGYTTRIYVLDEESTRETTPHLLRGRNEMRRGQVRLFLTLIVALLVVMSGGGVADAWTFEAPKVEEANEEQGERQATAQREREHREAEETAAAKAAKERREAEAREAAESAQAREREEAVAKERAEAEERRAARMCVVPSVKGDSLRSARQALLRDHCRLGHISRRHADGRGRWLVVKQDVRAGRHRRHGARVGVVVERATRRRAVPGGASTPRHGPLSTEPKLTPPAGLAPARLVTKELIVGLGARAVPGEPLTVNYVGALSDGKVFDTSWKHKEPFVFRLGRREVIEGWEEGLRGMRVGGRRELVIPASDAYGRRGSPPSIPPNATLIFIVDLLAV